MPLLAAEIVKDEPGQEAVLDRLLDLLLIAVLRAWFARPGREAPAWYRAHGDPVVGRALRLLHHDPATRGRWPRWPAAAGVSRAALARRFTELVGEPPMTFLTGWRLALAADLLREPDATVGAVAARSATAARSPSARRWSRIGRLESAGISQFPCASVGIAPGKPCRKNRRTGR